jgi:hypothetical protein
MSLIQAIARAIAPREKRLSLDKREMEKRLRAGGLSRAEAKKAVAAHFQGGSHAGANS